MISTWIAICKRKLLVRVETLVEWEWWPSTGNRSSIILWMRWKRCQDQRHASQPSNHKLAAPNDPTAPPAERIFCTNPMKMLFPPSCVPPSISRTRCNGWREKYCRKNENRFASLGGEDERRHTPKNVFSPSFLPRAEYWKSSPILLSASWLHYAERRNAEINKFPSRRRFFWLSFTRASQP